MLETPAIGIDLGTTYVRVSVWRNGRAETILNEDGKDATPTCIVVTPTGRIYGETAIEHSHIYPTTTIRDVRRLLDRRIGDKSGPFQFKSPGNDRPRLAAVGGKCWYPEQYTALILRKAKAMAETHLGTAIKYAVITIPSAFNFKQLQAILDAAEMAGLTVLRLIKDSLAVALGHFWETGQLPVTGLDNAAPLGEKNVLVFDLGGGTLDVAVLTIEDSIFEAKVAGGKVTDLGGIDMDNRLLNHLAHEVYHRHGKNVFNNARALARLRSACERAKCTLSLTDSTTVVVDFVDEGLNFSTTLTRVQLEDLCEDLLCSSMETVMQVLSDARMKPQDMHEIIMVGGMLQMPKLQQMLTDQFQGINIQVGSGKAAAHGAGILGAMLAGTNVMPLKEVLVLDVTSHSLSVQIEPGPQVLIAKSCNTIPCRKKEDVPIPISIPRPFLVQIVEQETHQLAQVPYQANHWPGHIQVDFNLGCAGELIVTLCDDQGQNPLKVDIKDSLRLPRNELNRMTTEVEQAWEEDEHVQAHKAARLRLEQYALTLRSNIIRNPKLVAHMRPTDMRKLDQVIAMGLQLSVHMDAVMTRSELHDLQEQIEMETNRIMAKYLGVLLEE
ncbi:hypothetical protein AMAG_00111 [Allomyces macrogynus ATCC 38327]|uniref:Hsp70-like protein n=1 Tax=Allomyces macrogynus (strain ATCC 38327) TaxID=578462 RepID=A0A0L0RUZ7_ALLM3|nr:hypothetical protein AMAG_00111 [Allomyces macrogynus ATCC 38327]|eukprot:KNE54108.1 hypothetical protein AMAG_00111 [Allomyces macrogynus ATCC 38327]